MGCNYDFFQEHPTISNERTPAQELIRLGLWNHRVQCAVARDVDLPVLQLECLLVLHLDQPASAGELASKLGIHKSSLSKLLAALQDRGLVQRDVQEADRRSQRISMTKEACELIAKAEKITDRIATALLERIPEERRTQFIGCVRTITSQDAPLDRVPEQDSEGSATEPSFTEKEKL